MRSYITGSAEDLANFNAQLGHLYNRPGLVVAGSIGRAAIYSQFNWETEPLPLRPHDKDDPDAGLRDIDVITARRPLAEEDFGTPHPVEDGVAGWFDEYGAQPSLMLSIPGGIRLFPVDAELLSPRTRQLDGHPVRTFPVGTLLAYQQFVEADMASGYSSLKHAAAHQEFRVFAETIRATHPDEFHPDELYQPFRDATFFLEQNL